MGEGSNFFMASKTSVGRHFAAMWASSIVRVVSAMSFETSGFFTVMALELAWYLTLWEAQNYFFFNADSCLVVATFTIWRLYVRSSAAKQVLTAKDSAQMQLSI